MAEEQEADHAPEGENVPKPEGPEIKVDEDGNEYKEYSGEKIMCFVSKEMVPIEETIELEVQDHKKVRVLPKYVKLDMDEVDLEA